MVEYKKLYISDVKDLWHAALMYDILTILTQGIAGVTNFDYTK